MTKLVIFDFDGTLVDTAKDCVACLNEAFRNSGYPERSYEEIVRHFGKSLPEIVRGAQADMDLSDEETEKICSAYKKIYGASEKPLSAPFAGMTECLQALQASDIRIAVYSNKVETILKEMVSRYFPEISFSGVAGYREGVAPKPAPDGVRFLMEQAGAMEEETIFVGDGRSDIETARNAGIPVFFVTWGTGDPADRMDPYISGVVDTVPWLQTLLLSYERTNERALRRVHKINLETLQAVHEIAVRHNVTYFLCFGALIGALRHHDMVPWDNDIDLLITREEFNKLKPFLLAELDPEKYELVMPEDYGDRYLDMVPRVNYKLADLQVFSEEMDAYYDRKVNKIALDFFFLDRIPENLKGKMTVLRLEYLYGLLNGKRYNNDIGQYPNFLFRTASKLLITLGKHRDTAKIRKKIERLTVRFDDDESIPILRMTNDTIKSFTKRFPAEYFECAKEIRLGSYRFMGPKEPEKVLTLFYGDYMELPPEEDRVPHLFNKNFTADLISFQDEEGNV